MIHLSIALIFIFLLGNVQNSYGREVTIQKRVLNGQATYYYDGKMFNSMDEVYAQLEKDYPGSQFSKPSSINDNSNGGQSPNSYGTSNGNYGGSHNPYGGSHEYNGNHGGSHNPYEGSHGYNGNNGGSNSYNGGNSGIDISKYIGNNPFSNPIFNRIWQGYNVNSDSRNGFSDMKKRLMEESNEYRRAHGAPPLQLDSELANKAQRYAEHIASIGYLVHDPKNQQEGTGENLALASTPIGHLAVKKWYDEIDLYDFNRPGFSSGTGHFTQLVWLKTNKAGFGVVEKNGNIYVVCKYTPPGNYQNQFPNNVLRRQ